MKTLAKMSDIRQAARSSGGQRWNTGAVERVVRRDTSSVAKAYGIEIELPCSCHGNEDEVFRELDKLPIDRKPDGSLGPYDIEFVFPPMSPNQWRMSKLFDQFLEQYQKLETRRTRSNYGTHIHTNVRGWHPVSAALVRPLIEHNAAFFRWLAGRSGYDGIYQINQLSSGRTGLSHRGTAGYSRHGTIEYRIFDSTTDRTVLLSWMRWLDAIEEYVRDPAVVASYRTKMGFTEENDPIKTCSELSAARSSSPGILYRTRETLFGSNIGDLLGNDVLNDRRFAEWLLSDYVRTKYPVVYNSFKFFTDRRPYDQYTGRLSYASNVERFINGETTNAQSASSSPSPQSA